MPTAFDLDASRQRVARSVRNVGEQPHLIGFEAVGIQEFIAANSRPLAMKGASTLIREFDEANLDQPRAAGEGGPIFAGGGRGLVVCPAASVPGEIARLQARYRDVTHGGQLAVAAVPLDVDDEAASLKWLRLRLDGAKDTAPPPKVPIPRHHDDRCTDCLSRRAETSYRGPEGPVPACWRCAAAVARGRQASTHNWTLEDLQTEGVVAVVSADGNNLGALFAELPSLEAAAICSDLVSTIFQQAHQGAYPSDGRFVDPVVGGDDIRMFLPPERVIDYITDLARGVDQLCGDLPKSSLPASIAKKVSKIGLGVGAVIAPFHYPASRLLAMAHDFEDSAKAACLESHYRSAVDFLWLRSGEELSQGLDNYVGSRTGAQSLEEVPWASYLARARALARVPTSQRAMLIDRQASPDDDPERANRYRYQVARIPDWRRWFEACGVDWRNPSKLAQALPTARMLDVASLLELSGRGATA